MTSAITYQSETSRTRSLSHAAIESLVLQFFLYSFLGWIWEVLLHVYIDHSFVNRGIMTGPWLPIYGTGAVLIQLLLGHMKEHPARLFASIMLLCGSMEYLTATVLDHMFHAKWWDYSDMLFQIHGKVCLSGLLLFGFGGCFIIYTASPYLENRIFRLPSRPRTVLCLVLGILFLTDLICSGAAPNMGIGITS